MKKLLKDYTIHITIGTIVAVVLFTISVVFWVAGVAHTVEANTEDIIELKQINKEIMLDMREMKDTVIRIDENVKIILSQ